MAVSIIGTPLAINDGTSYTAESGTDRVVVVVVGVEEFNSATFAPTFGAQAFTQAAFIEGSDRSYAYIGYIKEADIPAGSNAFALNPSIAVDEVDGTIYTLAGVDQTTVGSGYTLDSISSSAPVLNITGVANGLAVAVYEHESTGAITNDPAWTARSTSVGTNHKVATADKVTLAGADTYEPTTTSSQQGVLASFVFNEVAASATITDIDGDNNVQVGQTGAIITTSGIDAASVTQAVTLGGETLTITNWTTDAITVTIPASINLKWGRTDLQLAVTHDDGTTTLDNVTLSAPAGWETVTFTSAPDEASTESFYEKAKTDATLGGGGYTMTADDVLAWATSTGLTIDGQTIPVVDPAATVTGSYKIWDDTNETWTSTSTYTITDNGIYTGESSSEMSLVQPLVKPLVSTLVH